MEKLKNKKILAVSVFVVLLLLVGAIFGFIRYSQGEGSSQDDFIDSEIPMLSPEDIGMVVTLRPDKRALMFEIKKYQDIQRVEYEITYEKEIDGDVVPEGIFGEMNIADDGITKTDYREFGTCSAGVCRYDKVVSDILITLKVEKKDGNAYRVEKTVELN